MSKIKLRPSTSTALISLLSALCIVSRVALTLPNIKPVTAIIISTTVLFGASFSIKLAFVTTILSNIFLGFGVWTPFQILAWVVIILLASVIPTSNTLFMTSYAVLSGYIFGLVVSLEKVLVLGLIPTVFYWLNGLVFDTLHAIGNLVFYPICFYALKTITFMIIKEE